MIWTGRQLLELLCFPVAMAAGQVLFKRAASQITPGAGGSWLIEVARLPTMWVAVTLYAGATLFWGAHPHDRTPKSCVSVRGTGLRAGSGGWLSVLSRAHHASLCARHGVDRHWSRCRCRYGFMTPAFRWTLLWIAGSMVMVAGALAMFSASLIDHQYLPATADSFYHARRILDSVFSGNPVIQFDGRIHVPEGSWLVWPWGYDTVMARITSLGPFANRDDANRVLMNIPPAAAPIAVALVVNIARCCGSSACGVVRLELRCAAGRAWVVRGRQYRSPLRGIALDAWNTERGYLVLPRRCDLMSLASCSDVCSALRSPSTTACSSFRFRLCSRWRCSGCKALRSPIAHASWVSPVHCWSPPR